ncbi:paraquat-inducible protein A [Frigidibacter sp. MR17.24]|uniref:paraquat-inducible protein A n=1 Tax=Frigidibacter sp. MR17.24 TaxID=3127345 RepID=UPI003012AB66
MTLHAAPGTARAAGLVACRSCGRVYGPDRDSCLRCGAALHSRMPGSLQRVWAWWFAGLIVYIPANIYPMLITRTIAYDSEATILAGVVELAGHGDYGVAGIVFFASIMIPLSKFIAIAYLALSIGRSGGARGAMDEHRQHRLHTVVEFIGRWSMIDVFVVAILASLVQFDAIATINPGIAAVSFALSVAFTMLSAQSFDPRLIWDED